MSEFEMGREAWERWYHWYVGKDCKHYQDEETPEDMSTDKAFAALLDKAFSKENSPADSGERRIGGYTAEEHKAAFREAGYQDSWRTILARIETFVDHAFAAAFASPPPTEEK